MLQPHTRPTHHSTGPARKAAQSIYGLAQRNPTFPIYNQRAITSGGAIVTFMQWLSTCLSKSGTGHAMSGYAALTVSTPTASP